MSSKSRHRAARRAAQKQRGAVPPASPRVQPPPAPNAIFEQIRQLQTHVIEKHTGNGLIPLRDADGEVHLLSLAEVQRLTPEVLAEILAEQKE